MIPFFGTLPYVHNYSLIERILLEFLIWLFIFILYLLVATSRQKQTVVVTLRFNLKDWIGGLLGILMFVYVGAWLSANSLGLLVKLFPNEPCSIQVNVLNVENQGSKYKSIALDLKSQVDGKIYYLTLSKKIFDYPEIKSGDKMTLQGKQNIFGIYIESFKVF